jgi:hypothetical protein
MRYITSPFAAAICSVNAGDAGGQLSARAPDPDAPSRTESFLGVVAGGGESLMAAATSASSGATACTKVTSSRLALVKIAGNAGQVQR